MTGRADKLTPTPDPTGLRPDEGLKKEVSKVVWSNRPGFGQRPPPPRPRPTPPTATDGSPSGGPDASPGPRAGAALPKGEGGGQGTAQGSAEPAPALAEKLEAAVAGARQEWGQPVVYDPKAMSNPRLEEYAAAAGTRFRGSGWGGHFLAFVYTQCGFRYPKELQSAPKALDFFLYRRHGRATDDPENWELEQLRQAHESEGTLRRLFLFAESPSRARITADGPWGRERYPRFDMEADTFACIRLPVVPGDLVIFARGHCGVVASFEPKGGTLTTIEGDTAGRSGDGKHRLNGVVEKSYALSVPEERGQIDGFGRMSVDDFE